ncbi:Glycerophosphoryl diester phosphodiesterase [Handroanthus impetiginosus]|uniref:glycerophosphodiester phosphodiesterase n=1 Tax=Handroanthus impetiginosus TaxID=429701 RepID=A0A2G9IB52_9LAMI|nr:Glycerophosphoryl diester phosphodiesterase [Handroanthus impetiginosus]
MWKLQSVLGLLSILLLCSSAALVAAQRSRTRGSRWQTLSGDAPLVIARGGFSGLFPDSSIYAYSLAVQTGLPNLHVWCDVQLTKDGAGICFPDIRMENASDIDNLYSNRSNTYLVNGVSTQAWFSVDFTLEELGPVDMKQRIYSRAPNFDATPMQILTVEDVVTQTKPPGLWLNVAHDIFFSQHNLSMRSFVLSLSRRVIVNYVSSSEVGFLRSIVSRFRTGPTKIVFQFLRQDDVEPSTNQTYGSLLGNLTFIKTFATGILVPKNYIWPVDSSQYLQNYTSLVLDAHAAGLEVFASNFVTDAVIPYDYSYDPVAEYLSFIDNGKFSVDGVLSDFPITASETVDCFSHMGKNETVKANVSVISSEGASGDYPGCTDVAYKKAVSDGVDILDCPIQITNDRIPFCLGSINLRDRTNVAQTDFGNRMTNNPDLNIENGVFAYNLTWAQIQTLRPAMFNPYPNYSLFRNPRARNDGNLMQLADFLALANNASSVSGVLISIENAAYLAERQGLGVTDAVLDALSKAGYNNQTGKKVMIKSSDSAVLLKFKSSSNYELVYLVDEDVRDVSNSTILEIKKFASSVVVSKKSVLPTAQNFVTGQTSVVPKLQAFNLPVYVQFFRNEFVSQPWDFFCDAYVEINTHVSAMGINGVITDFPATAAKYKRNRCLGYKEIPLYMAPVEPRGLISVMTNQGLPPAEAPSPVLTENDVTEPPLPPVMERTPTQNGSAAPGPTSPNGQPTLVASVLLSCIAILLAAFVLC